MNAGSIARRVHVAGLVRVPGDKSITHRALLLAALAPGESVLGGALTSLDTRSTARVLRGLGVAVSALRAETVVRVRGRRRFQPPAAPLHCGNSGTTARLLLGILAAHRFAATLTGDASLRRRPMRRVLDPLVQMGARVLTTNPDRLPVTIRGGTLSPLEYDLPVASAQVKSGLLLAGLAGRVPVTLRECGPSRDHTERMLGALGITLARDARGLHFQPGARLHPFQMQIPGDISSAAFLAALALLADTGELVIHAVGLNPTRTGVLSVLRRMGGNVTCEVEAVEMGEPIGWVRAAPSTLRGVEVAAPEIPSIIDEIPVLAALATRARGSTLFRQAGELRVKESDRLALLASNIRRLGGRAEVQGDDLWVEGDEVPLRGTVQTAGDHRLAMAFAVLGALPGCRIRIDRPAAADVSFPGFATLLKTILQRAPRG